MTFVFCAKAEAEINKISKSKLATMRILLGIVYVFFNLFIPCTKITKLKKLAGRLHLKFLHRFPGTIWNTVLLPEKNLLFLEVRNQREKRVSFFALQYVNNVFLLKNFQLEEAWWVSLSAAVADKMIFTLYIETQNPDKKGILVYDIQPPKLVWWNNDFSLTSTAAETITGYSSKWGNREITLAVKTGEEVPNAVGEDTDLSVIFRPVQYSEGTPHFATVKTFLEQKLNLSAVGTFEYLEFDSRIFVSYYVRETGLANYLLIMDEAGEVLLHEKLDEQLKGIGMETFFVLAGCVFFVKNREDLVSYFL